MKLEKIIIENFASYYGEHSLDLNTDQDKPVIIIIGGNGFGKTSLFQAINWALYGEDYEKDLKKYYDRKIVDYVNEASLTDGIMNNEIISMSANLYFSHNTDKYLISQNIEVSARKEGDKLFVQEEFKSTKLSQITPKGDHVDIPHHKLLLNELLPSNVRDYFLFDGDRIYKLASPGSSSEVRDAIYRVVDLELLQNAQDHLEEIAREFGRAAKRESTGELKDIEDQYNTSVEKKDKLIKDIKQNTDEIRSIRDQLDIIENKLRDLPDTGKIQAKIDNLKSEVIIIQDDSENLIQEKRKLAYQMSGILVGDVASDLITNLDNKREKGEIPKNVSKTFLEEMLRSKKCFICNEEIIKGNKLYESIQKRLEIEKKKKDDQVLLDYNFQLKALSSIIDNSKIKINEIEKQLNEFDKQKTEKQLLIDQFNRDLAKLPKEDIQGLLSEQKSRHEELEKRGRREANYHHDLETLKIKISELESQRIELAKKQKNVRAMQLREMLAHVSSEQIAVIYKDFAEESRASVEKLTIDEFRNFVFSSSGYEVRLNENYELVVLDSNGQRVLQRLSMGQSQCLSLAFITAISRVSEKYPPLVIDMPFGRLDEEVHGIVSKRLPELTKQLILFLLPNTEWNVTTKKALKSKAKHIYCLDFDSKSRKTNIGKYHE